MGETLREKIVFEIETPKPVGGGLAALAGQLEKIDAYITQINAKIAGMKVEPQFMRSFNQLESEIKKLQTKGSGLGVEGLSKGLGIEVEAAKRMAMQMKDVLKGFNASKLEFRSAPNAASFFHEYSKQQRAGAKEAADGFKNFFTPTVAQVQLGSLGAEAKIEGFVPITIPAAQVNASVVGQIQLVIPGAQVSGAAGGGGGLPRDPATGRILPGGGGGKGKSPGGKQPLNAPGSDREIERVRVETEHSLKETVTEAEALGVTVSKTYDSVEGWLKTVTRTAGGKGLLEKFREQRAKLEEGYKAAKAGLKPGDYAGLGKLQESQAAGMGALMNDPAYAGLGNNGLGSVAARVQGKVDILKAQAEANRGKAAAARAAALQQQADENFAKRQAAEEATKAGFRNRFQSASQAFQQRQDAAAKAAEEARAASVEQATRNNKARQLLRKRQEERTPPIIPPPLPLAPGKYAQALQSFLPAGLALNVLKVSGWAAAVAVLYKSLELASHSAERLVAIGGQTARLEQIFHGVGGSAQELTQDVLGLAAASGRSTEEAMEAGIAWARLGLNRVQINQAVRVSLMAANVANVEAGDATRYLSSIMAVYGLQVRDLDGVLGMLTTTANKFNVTNRDLFDGISRSAAVAKQAGIPLAELQGIIGAAVGRTGQSGSNIGNALKSVIVSLSSQDNQAYLRRGLKIEPLGVNAGEMKSTSEVLREIYVRYQSLNEEEKRNLTVRIAGKTQSSRFVAIMESWVQAQKLAVDAQLNLNSAQTENAKILETQKAQLAGLGAAWDKFVVKAGNAKGLMPGGGSINQSLVMALRLAQVGMDVGGALLPGAANNDAHRRVAQLTQVKGWAGVKARVGFLLQHPGSIFEAGVSNLENYFHPGKNQFDLLSENQLRARSGAAGYQQRARLLRTVAEGLQKGTPENNQAAVKDLLPGDMGKWLEKLVASPGGGREAQAVLKRAATEAEAQAKEQVQAEIAAKNQALALLNQQKATQQTAADKAGEGSEPQAQAKTEIVRLDEQINELLGQRKQLLDEEADATEKVEGRTQAMVNLMQQQKTISEAIGELYQQMPADTATERLDSRLAVLQAEREALAGTIVEMGKGTMNDQRIGDIKQLEEQKREVIGQIHALSSPQNRGLVALQDNRALAFRNAAEQAQGYGVGTSEAEKLLNREKRDREELQRLGNSKTPLTDNQAARMLQLEVDLHRTKESIQTRINYLKGQEQQIQLESVRNFQKSLLFAGPGELLQKLAAAQMSAKGVTAGQWFSMSPEMRRIIDELHGGDAGRQNRIERGLLKGRGETVEQQQAEAAQAAARRGNTAAWLGQMGTGAGRGPAATVDPELRARVAAAGQVTKFGAVVGQTAMVVDQFKTVVTNAMAAINKAVGALPPLKPGMGSASGVMLDTGFALGANA